jgi:hypothetical protein
MNAKLLRRTSYIAGRDRNDNLVIMTMYKGQTYRIKGVECKVHTITRYSDCPTPRREVQMELPAGELFVWKQIYDSGVIDECEIDELL